MKSKLYKTHRKPSYYRLKRLGYLSLSLIATTLIIVLPLTFAQASNQSSTTVSESSTTSSESTTTESSLDEASESSSSEETSQVLP
jgi:uncharacterized protein YpmS